MRISSKAPRTSRGSAFGIILKFLFRNIAEKKGRTILIVLSVTLSSALFLSTTGMGTTMENMFARRVTQYIGGAQIIIHANRTSPSWLHSPGRLERSGITYEYAVPSIQFSGSARKGPDEWTDVDIRGFTLAGLSTLTSPVWVGQFPREFRGNSVIIGEHSAEHFNIGAGDPLTVLIGETPHRLYVSAVARSAGLFTDDGRTHTIILPLERLAAAVAGRGRASITYVRASREEDIPKLLEEIREVYPRYEVREAFPRADIDRFTREMTTPFTIMSFLVFFMSVFIIYTSFRVITLEGLPVIGTFRSVGATRRSTNGILLGESFLYGVVGGLPGIFLGLGILWLLARVSAWDWLNTVATKLVVTPGQIVATLAAAVILSAGSAAVPIRQAARLPVKDVVLGRVRHEIKRRPLRYILGGLMLLGGAAVPHFLPVELMMFLGSVSMFSVMIGTVLVLPWIVRHLVHAFAKVNRRLFGNIGELATKNLRDDPSVINNIALLTIGISGLFMITTMSVSASGSLTDFYRHAQFDVWMWTQNADRTTESRLRSLRELEDIQGVLEVRNIEMEGRNSTMEQIIAVEGPDLADWWAYPIHDDDPESLLARLDEGRSLILSLKSKRRLEVEKGDTLTLLLGDPPRPRPYEVIGFLTMPDDTGGFALAGIRWIKLDTGRTKYSDYWVKASGDPAALKRAIENLFRRRPLWVSTLAELEETNAREMREIFLMLQFFGVLAMLIASVGIVNNFLVSYLERKRILAVIRSVGMDRRQTMKMLLVEAMTGGVLGTLIGMLGGLAMVSYLPRYMMAFDLGLELVLSPPGIAALFGLGVLLALGGQLLPSVKSGRMNLVEALKYE